MIADGPHPRADPVRPAADQRCGPARRAPATTVTSTPADRDRPAVGSVISHTSVNVTITVCGTSAAPTPRGFATAPTTRGTGWPVPRSVAVCARLARRVDNPDDAHQRRHRAHRPRETAAPAPTPCARPARESPRRPTATPSGCAVWRMPIARPRWSGGNQPDHQPAAGASCCWPRPCRRGTGRRRPATSECDRGRGVGRRRGQRRARPSSRCARRPGPPRSPSATSVTTMPKLGIDDTRPASARSESRARCAAWGSGRRRR